MKKALLGKATILALAALCSTAIVPGCSGSSATHKPAADMSNFGNIGFAVQVAPGVEVDTVHYVVSGNGQNLSGDIPVANAGSTISVQVGLPAGTGYTITMTGTSTDGKTNCTGTATFDVTAGITTAVSVRLQCTGVHVLGSARVNGTLNVCPTVDTYTVAPLQVAVGGTINLTATGSDTDGDPVTFAWTASAGTVTPGNASSAVYSCSVPGNQTLTITASDGDPQCNDASSIQVTCVALACGNGTIDTGEQCDDGANNGKTGDPCDANCQKLCGNGVIDASDGETCEPPGSISCDAQCHKIVGCGNGIIEPPEQCDDGASNGTPGDKCTANCTNTCGNGVVDPGEQCDDGANNGTPNDSCSATCQTVQLCGNGTINTGEQCDPPEVGVCSANCTTDACRTCELGNPTASADYTACFAAAGTVGAGGDGLSVAKAGTAKSAACKAIIDCVRSTHCSNGGNNPEYCYCGPGVDIPTCQGMTNATVTGVCKDLVSDGAESVSVATIAARFFNPAFATGLAFTVNGDDNAFCTAVTSCF